MCVDQATLWRMSLSAFKFLEDKHNDNKQSKTTPSLLLGSSEGLIPPTNLAQELSGVYVLSVGVRDTAFSKSRKCPHHK